MQHPIGEVIKNITGNNEEGKSGLGALALIGGLGLATYLLAKDIKKENPIQEKTYSVPKELFNRYLDIIYKQSLVRNDIPTYKFLDTERQKIHEEILKACCKDRLDRDFEFWLATKVEKELAKLEGIIQEENPRSPEDYAKMFSILSELRNSVVEKFGQFAPDSSYINSLTDKEGLQYIINTYKKTDRVETILHIIRYKDLAQYFERLSHSLLTILINHIRTETADGEKADIDYINEVLESLDKILSDSIVSRAFSMFKNYYIKANALKPELPIANFDFKGDPKCKYIHQKFPMQTWKRTLLEELYGGYSIFLGRADSLPNKLDTLFHFVSLLVANENFRQLADNIVWNSFDINSTIEKLSEKERELIEENQQSKTLSSAIDPIFIDMGDWKWVISDPEEEARMMAHCGREGKDMVLLSLRRYDKKKDKITAHVSAAFYFVHLDNDPMKSWGYLTQMKGRGNNKLTEKYHPQIIKLLLDPRVQAKLPGKYKPEADFQINDLKIHEIELIKQEKPQLMSLVAFKKVHGSEQTIALLKILGLPLGNTARVEGDNVIFYDWEDEESFVRDIAAYVPSSTADEIKSAWNWAQEFHDLGYNPTWKDIDDATDNLVTDLERLDPELYKQLESYLEQKYPSQAVRAALDSLEEDEGNNNLVIEAFIRAFIDGEEVGFSNNIRKEFINSIEQMTWYSGAYITVNNSPFKITLQLDMTHFDKLLKGELEVDIDGDYTSNLFYELEHDFKMGDVESDYSEEGALNYLREIGLPEALAEIRKEKNPSKKGRKKNVKKHNAIIRVREFSSLPLIQKALQRPKSKRNNRDSSKRDGGRTRKLNSDIA